MVGILQRCNFDLLNPLSYTIYDDFIPNISVTAGLLYNLHVYFFLSLDQDLIANAGAVSAGIYSYSDISKPLIPTSTSQGMCVEIFYTTLLCTYIEGCTDQHIESILIFVLIFDFGWVGKIMKL